MSKFWFEGRKLLIFRFFRSKCFSFEVKKTNCSNNNWWWIEWMRWNGEVLLIFSVFFGQVYPEDTPLTLFTTLLPEDLGHVTDTALRARVWNAVETARQWIQREEVIFHFEFNVNVAYRKQSRREVYKQQQPCGIETQWQLIDVSWKNVQYPRKVHEKCVASYWFTVKNWKFKSVYLLKG